MSLFRICAFAFLAVFLTPLSFAQGLSENQRQALNNFQAELLECAMFYEISAVGLKRNGSPASIASSPHANKSKEELVMMASLVGKRIGMSVQGMTEWANLSYKSQMKKMDGNFVNYSILLQEYLEPCTVLLNDAVGRLNQALES